MSIGGNNSSNRSQFAETSSEVMKQYFDCVLHPGLCVFLLQQLKPTTASAAHMPPGLTFTETSSGPTGLLGGGRPVVLLTSSGGVASKDYVTPWLLETLC